MKLEDLLGEELYSQVQAKLDEVNGKEPDKLKHIRYADLSEGEYVGKGKHDALQLKFDNQEKELAAANKLIEELNKGTKDNEALQGKISGYENQVAALQQELAETRIKYAVRDALREAKAVDVDYLSYKLDSKLKSNGKAITLDENGTIKGWDEMVSGLKTQFPNQFEGDSSKKIIENRLPERKDYGSDEPNSLEAALKLAYEPKEE